jgi:sugar lactone lactonase YvrE
MKKPRQLGLLFVAALIGFFIASCKNTVVHPSYTIDSSTSLTAGFGDTIIIRGSNLQSGVGFTIIRLNGKIFSITNSSDSYIKARVPVGAGNGQITITINGQTFNGPQFTYVLKTVVSTLAGSGTAGNADGTGTKASFNQPWGLIVGADSNIYVADESNHAIRKITPKGLVSTITIPPTVNGANFYAPYNVAINNTTNTLYMTDFNTDMLAMGVDGSNPTIIYNGTAPTAGIAVGPDGKIYMGNYNAGTITQLSADGKTVTPFANVPTPRSIIFDSAGNMYVAGFDPAKNSSAIYQVSSTGVATVLYDDPVFKGYEIAVDQNGIFYEADYFGNTIRMIDKSGNITTLAGNGTAADKDGLGTNASFNGPHGIAVDAKGAIYVSTFNPTTGGGNDIRKIVVQ